MLVAMDLHQLLEHGPQSGDLSKELRTRLAAGADLEARAGASHETPLHVATRRHRTEAVELLLEAGCELDGVTAGGKTAFAHALRRGFDELAGILRGAGACTDLDPADNLAVALTHGHLAEARALLTEDPGLARTGNPEEDRLLADLTGRAATEPVALLLEHGADLAAPGLDLGTPLHQAAWFGQPANARLLLDAGAPLEVFEAFHGSSPLGWAVHGSRFSGGAAERASAYEEVTALLLAAGARLAYPDEQPGPDAAYARRLLEDAAPGVRVLLEEHLARTG